MTNIKEAILSSGFTEDQVRNLVSLFIMAEQEKDNKAIEAPSQAQIDQKILDLEVLSQNIDINAGITDLKKKKVPIDPELLTALTNENIPKIRALLLLNQLFQDKMKRPANSERQQLADTDVLEASRERITSELINLGLIGEVKPQNKTPEALLILGAAQKGFTDRLQTTIKYLEDEKIQPGAIYLLGGQRPLWPADEPVLAELLVERLAGKDYQLATPMEGSVLTKENLQNDLIRLKSLSVTDNNDAKQITEFRETTAKNFEQKYGIKWPTELDMMERVAKHQELDKKGFKIIAVDTPMQMGEDGKAFRPQTQHTVASFRDNYAPGINVAPGKKISVIATSSQPHVLYQRKVFEAVLSADQFDIEVVGKGISDKNNYKMREAFDALASSVFAGLGMSLKKLVCLDQRQNNSKKFSFKSNT